MASIQDAYNRLLYFCNMENPYCLYSQTNREMGTDAEGNIYFDCSSIISYVLFYAGILSYNPWFTTFDMAEYLTEEAGFTTFDPNSTAWQNGDIMVRHSDYLGMGSEHTEMVYDASSYVTMGAHDSDRARADQVSVSSYSSQGMWQIGFRYEDGWVPTPTIPWTTENFPDEWTHFTEWEWHTDPDGPGFEITSVEAQDNAQNVFTYAWQVGWTRYAICALLGNIQAESGLNPGRHEVGGTGYGLVQWTPQSVLETALEAIFGTSQGEILYSGHHQMLVILAEYMQANYEQGHEWALDSGIGRQWINSTGSLYGFDLEAVDWYTWATSRPEQTDDASIEAFIENLTLQFMVSYLRPDYDPDTNHWTQRVNFALVWYGLLRDFAAPSPTAPADAGKGFLYCPRIWWWKTKY